MKNIKGFTLVEIMIVVAIIALLAAISIPNLLRARVNANESAAIAALQTVSAAAQSYRSTNPAYPGALDELGAATPPYIDDVLAAGAKSGFNFSLQGETNTFYASARPSVPGSTGARTFYVDEEGVIRWAACTSAAACTDATSGSNVIGE